MTSVNNSHLFFAMIKKNITAAVNAAVLNVETDAKILAPIRTGNHRRSIYSEVTEENNVIIGRVSHHSDYGMWLELGTRFMAARPHFRPAIEMNRANTQRLIQGAAHA